MNQSNQQSKIDYIDEKLMGLEIIDSDNDYGIVCRIDQVNSDFVCYTTRGYKFNAGLLLNLVAAVNRMEDAANKAESNTDPNIEYLAPENTFANTQVRSRPKAHSKQMSMNGRVNNTAEIGDEKINITSTVSSSEKFAEESYNKKVGE